MQRIAALLLCVCCAGASMWAEDGRPAPPSSCAREARLEHAQADVAAALGFLGAATDEALAALVASEAAADRLDAFVREPPGAGAEHARLRLEAERDRLDREYLRLMRIRRGRARALARATRTAMQARAALAEERRGFATQKP